MIRLRPGDVAELDALARRMDDAIGAGEQETWSELNYRFHRRMYEIAERPHSLRIITQLLSLVEPYSRAYVHGMKTYERVQAEHHRMVAALRDRDADVLATLTAAHLGGARSGLVEFLGDSATTQDPLEVLRDLTRSAEAH